MWISNKYKCVRVQGKVSGKKFKHEEKKCLFYFDTNVNRIKFSVKIRTHRTRSRNRRERVTLTSPGGPDEGNQEIRKETGSSTPLVPR